MPSDLTGIHFYNQKTGPFEFRPGPLLSNIVLADEINRATPRTQSSLLEAMEERQVTVDGKTMPLEEPFMVMATQNPLESYGTFPLPEAQIDRFFMKLSLGYMIREQEMSVLARPATVSLLAGLSQTVTEEETAYVRSAYREVKVSPDVMEYLMDIIEGTRAESSFVNGVSTRAAGAVFGWIYQTVCYPILMLFTYLLVGIIQIIAWLFSWVQFHDLSQQSSQEVTVNTAGLEDMIEGMETGRNSDMFMRVVTALVLISAAVALFFIFRWLSNRAHRDPSEAIADERTKAERRSVSRRFLVASSPVERVRLQYRKYLKLCRANGFAFEKSETSQEIEEKTGTAMDTEDVHAMRQIYTIGKEGG